MENTSVQKIGPADEIKGALVKMAEAGQLPLPKHINPERFVAVAQMAVMNNMDLVRCDKASIYQAVSRCAQDGLFPDGREAAIVPFGGKAKYMPMVAGICKKARNSGEVSAIDALVVHENDEYDCWTDENGPHFKYKRAYKNRGQVLLTFAYAIMKDKSCMIEEIDEDQMKAIREKSKASDSPWKGPFEDEMRRKSGLRRLAKYRLPNSSDLDNLFKEDNEFYEEPEKTGEEAPTRPSRLGAIIEAEAEEVTDAPAASAQDAAKDVFPASRPVAAPAARPSAPAASVAKPTVAPAAKPAAPKPSTPAPLIIKGVVQKMTAKDGVGANGAWRRIAVQLDGKFYGTFDEKMADVMQAAWDSKAETTITYRERKEGETTFRDILKIEYEEGEPVAESEVPI